MLKFSKVFAFFLLLYASDCLSQNTFTISGYVRELGTRESLIGVNVTLENSTIGTSTNTYGFYSLTLNQSDSITLVYSFVGFNKAFKKIVLNKNHEINVELETENILEELTVSGQRENAKVSETVQMSKIDLPVSQIKKLPTLLGEKDVLRVLQLMPGVQKGSEGQSGIYVRGGGPDQNLIILDDAVVYNASHLFGFFSTFNGDALKSVELTKGGFPARYGGRLSSVIEMNMKDGNKTKLSGEGGLGLISSRLLLEGPIRFNKNKPSKSSFIISGRRTYLDQVAKPFINARNSDSDIKETAGYYFYDLNAKLNYEFSDKDKIYLSGYFGRDKFGISSKTAESESSNGIDWGNATATFRWNHQYNQRLFSNTSLIYSDYQFNIFGFQDTQMTENTEAYSFNLQYKSGIKDLGLKYDVDFFPNQFHTIKTGFQITSHTFTPSATVIQEVSQNIDLSNTTKIKSLESAVYIEDTYLPFPNLKINGGLRISNFNTKSKSYVRPETRIAVAYKIKSDLALKASFAQMNQYLHLLSNTGLGLPTDLWVPATDSIAPQQSKQIAIGLAKDLKRFEGISVTIEAYYKKMNSIINYKEGASFLDIGGSVDFTKENNWEDKVTAGNGVSYGLEFMIQKKVGRFSGWIGYTLSKTEWLFEELNFGKKFYPKYDRRHDASIVGIYELNKKITISSTWVYGTGNALTIPLTQYVAYTSNINKNRAGSSDGIRGFEVNEYGQKNSFRAEAYHRMDLGVQFHKTKKHHERTWDVSIYNLYSRKNPFFYSLGNENETAFFGGFQNNSTSTSTKIVLKRYSLFPIIPSITYSFKF
ncbi:TonB-dependent receptor [Lacihabitans sp. LS3-19]|uniref:TonB-dependent receptor n=1 Tax=Lacihabitans sp. LS3-19 TaxID=2487335 RepID=UPI0020CF280A|nr:TonB-dependent receptor [Lacihabitans sp. LS3-19]MCP9767555.1 TonB-dependent receptor [Lacihabitans sp. LS3-19]